ncbi:phosphate ABC transporter substrate-binding protein PstS [uncultured Ferrovibrio sp.]|uniref:phosphate ABC transporter substrate-binding protein PstS n=1 Tax=uncultured Ferrovibrio sp. TaxID=1576913 RepID=UPI002621B25E|nr:phosphate ABC transporter substrate-binding protein PstS [uncultured Ferrovibrio sp.]
MFHLKPVMLKAAVVALVASVSLGGARAADISGAGASFPYPIYTKWAAAYKKETGIGLNYQSIGSGGGIKQIKAKTVTFGASDMPLKAKDLEDSGLVQFPMIIGGVVPVANIKGIKPGELVIDGPTLANIFLGKVKRWNDEAIKKLNPDIDLPKSAIAVVHRSDGSGTTFLFTDYLSKASAAWKSEVGAATAVQWPTGIGAKGNEGVANMTGQTDGAIGYVEYAYAKQNKLTHLRMINKAGKAVQPDSASFKTAAANADWAGTPGFEVILTDAAGDNSWPITGASFILMHKNPQDAASAAEALKFFDWAFKSGEAMADELDYVAMPQNVADLVRKAWSSQIQSGGKPLFAAQ